MTTKRGKRWSVTLGPCQDVEPGYTADHIITDPPFDAHTHENAAASRQGADVSGIDFATIEPATVSPWLLERARRWTLAFCTAEMLGEYKAASGGLYVRGGIWWKPNPTPQLTGDRPAQWGESIAIMHAKGRKRWNGGGRPARWEFGVENGKKEHPTQKPLALMSALILDFTDPGESIFDPYAGSGSTGVSAVLLGRTFRGFELNPDWFEIACDRLSDAEQGHATRGGDERDVAKLQTSLLG